MRRKVIFVPFLCRLRLHAWRCHTTSRSQVRCARCGKERYFVDWVTVPERKLKKNLTPDPEIAKGGRKWFGTGIVPVDMRYQAWTGEQ